MSATQVERIRTHANRAVAQASNRRHRRVVEWSSRALGRAALVGTFALAATRYWLTVFPRVCLELRRSRRRAARIPDPALRRCAFDALAKRSNVDGAAAFAVLRVGRRRRALVRALVAFQLAYNYLDALAEQPGGRSPENARRLHQALFAAVGCEPVSRDFYEHHAQSRDGGYLAELVEVCRAALTTLPSYACVAQSLHEAVARIVGFQSLSLAGERELERWAVEQLPDSRLRWWEIAAGAGSSLGVHALIAVACARTLPAEDLRALDGAYFPVIGALHSLLDSVVDVAEDATTGQLSLVGCYRGRQAAATRMGALTGLAMERARALPDARRHNVLLVAMACNYLSSPSSQLPEVVRISRAVREQLGALTVPTLLVFRVRALLARLARSSGHRAAPAGPLRAVPSADRQRSADARVA
jgi:tetraprenyl-beta-curcumene synthase